MTCTKCQGRVLYDGDELKCIMCGYSGPTPTQAAHLMEAVESIHAERVARGRKPLQGAALVNHQARLGRVA